MGSVFGFLRADNSWHGHLPFAGERRVVQVAWIPRCERAGAQEKAQPLSAIFQVDFRPLTNRASRTPLFDTPLLCGRLTH
jgi:hypothetical protein